MVISGQQDRVYKEQDAKWVCMVIGYVPISYGHCNIENDDIPVKSETMTFVGLVGDELRNTHKQQLF